MQRNGNAVYLGIIDLRLQEIRRNKTFRTRDGTGALRCAAKRCPQNSIKMAWMKLRFEKTTLGAAFPPGIIRETSRLRICSITQWGNMEREGGGNIVATRIARGHKYHFDLPGCERMARASRAWRKLWILSRDIKAKQSRCDGQRAFSNETIASNMWLCRRNEDESPVNSRRSTLRLFSFLPHVHDFAKFSAKRVSIASLISEIAKSQRRVFNSKKHFIAIFRISRNWIFHL